MEIIEIVIAGIVDNVYTVKPLIVDVSIINLSTKGHSSRSWFSTQPLNKKQ